MHISAFGCLLLQNYTLVFSKHGTGHAFKRLGLPCPATFFFFLRHHPDRDTLSPWAKHVHWQRVFQWASGFKVRNLIYWTGAFAIYVRLLLDWRYIFSPHRWVTRKKKQLSTVAIVKTSFSSRYKPCNLLFVFTFFVFLSDQIFCQPCFQGLWERGWSLVDPAFVAFIVCGPHQFLVSKILSIFMASFQLVRMSFQKSISILIANIKIISQKSTQRNITLDGIANPPSKYLPGKTQSYDSLRAHPYFQSLHDRVQRRVVCGGTRKPANSITTSEWYVMKIKWQSA